MQTLSYIQETESLVMRHPSKEGRAYVRAAYRALHAGHAARRLSAKSQALMVARMACGQARRTLPAEAPESES